MRSSSGPASRPSRATISKRPAAPLHYNRERRWPGEFADVRLILTTRKGVPTVPQQTVQVGPNGYYAYVIKADDTVERRAVKVAAMQDGVAVIEAGLAAGEKIV